MGGEGPDARERLRDALAMAAACAVAETGLLAQLREVRERQALLERAAAWAGDDARPEDHPVTIDSEAENVRQAFALLRFIRGGGMRRDAAWDEHRALCWAARRLLSSNEAEVGDAAIAGAIRCVAPRWDVQVVSRLLEDLVEDLRSHPGPRAERVGGLITALAECATSQWGLVFLRSLSLLLHVAATLEGGTPIHAQATELAQCGHAACLVLRVARTYRKDQSVVTKQQCSAALDCLSALKERGAELPPSLGLCSRAIDIIFAAAGDVLSRAFPGMPGLS